MQESTTVAFSHNHLNFEPEVIQPTLHPFYRSDMDVEAGVLAAGVARSRAFLSPESLTGIPLSIRAFSQSPYHTYFMYDDQEPGMIRFDDCVVCQTKVIDVSSLTDRRGQQYLTYGLCPTCGFFQHSVRPPREFYHEFYRKRWDPNKRSEETWPDKVTPQDGFYRAVAGILSPGAKVLDIGSGFGGMLLPFQEKGFRCFGIDAGEHRAEFVRRKLGIEVFTGEAENLPLGQGEWQPESFDLMFSNHVLEHVYDTREVLEHLFPLLKKGGLAFLCIPNYYQENLTCNTHDLSHTCSFSRENFIWLLESIGFELILDYSDALNVTILARKAEKPSENFMRDKLKVLKEYLPHRGLAYILEKNGLSPIPKNLSKDLSVKMQWSFPAYGGPPVPFINLTYDVMSEFSPALDALRKIVSERRSLQEAVAYLPIRYVYKSHGVPIWYY